MVSSSLFDTIDTRLDIVEKSIKKTYYATCINLSSHFETPSRLIPLLSAPPFLYIYITHHNMNEYMENNSSCTHKGKLFSFKKAPYQPNSTINNQAK